MSFYRNRYKYVALSKVKQASLKLLADGKQGKDIYRFMAEKYMTALLFKSSLKKR